MNLPIFIGQSLKFESIYVGVHRSPLGGQDGNTFHARTLPCHASIVARVTHDDLVYSVHRCFLCSVARRGMQWGDDGYEGEDRCNDNVVSRNTIETNGNECVETKEGSSGNIIQHNVCSNQDDSESGCFGSRGDGNTFRYIYERGNVHRGCEAEIHTFHGTMYRVSRGAIVTVASVSRLVFVW